MFKGRVRTPTYDELEEELLNPKLIVMNRPIKIPRLGYIQNIDDVDFNDFDLNNHNLKTMIEKVDKETQKNYELQNHDLFPEMYEEIDATGSDMGNNEKEHKPKDSHRRVLIFIAVLTHQVISQVLHHLHITYHDLHHQKLLNKKPQRKKVLGFLIQGSGICIED